MYVYDTEKATVMIVENGRYIRNREFTPEGKAALESTLRHFYPEIKKALNKTTA